MFFHTLYRLIHCNETSIGHIYWSLHLLQIIKKKQVAANDQ